MSAPRAARDVVCVFALLAAAGGATASGETVEPFRTRNLSPPIAIFGLPAWETVRRESMFGATTDVANHYRLSQRAGDRLILDGETLRTSLFYSRPLGERWSVSIEAPFYQQSGGVLDDLIDGWHTAFDLPDGGRNNRAEGEILYEMSVDGVPFFVLDDADRGIGDVQVSLARRFGNDDGFVVRSTVKLATGNESVLAGSGSTDWSLTVLRPRAVTFAQKPAGYFWGVGVLDFGEPERLLFPTKGSATIGIVGGSWKAWPRIGLKAQIDVYSALYRTSLEELGQNAAQVSFGGWWDMSEHGVLEFAVNEDLHVSTAPDVVLHMNLRWRW
jgi:hypothetical protein